jgi:hypothetical protein
MAEPSRAVSFDLTTPDALVALQTAPERLSSALRTEVVAYMRTFVAPNGPFQRARLAGRPGLRRRSGDLSRSFAAVDATSGPGLGDVAARGFTRSRYATVHEFGAWILPHAKPRLVWKDEKGRFHSAQQVYIPPRLHFIESFARDEGGRATAVRRAVARALRSDGGAAGAGSYRAPKSPLGPLIVALPGGA